MFKLQQDRGFSLVEIMIVVAIIAILVSIAVPKFLAFSLKSKMSEATSNLALIRRAQISYRAENDTFMECGLSPPAPAGSDGKTYAWVEVPNGAGSMGFEEIGFKPDGVIRYQYEVRPATAIQFVAIAESDLDNDGVPCKFTIDNQDPDYSKPERNPPGEF
jgi:prepilin-type N-terminal cleavage/methylation domain-containing protein